MPRDSDGKYTLPSAYNPVVPDTTIESDWANNTLNDVASALTGSISANGETTPTANLPMGGYHHVNVSSPTARNQYLTAGMAQDGDVGYITISSISGDNLEGDLSIAPPAYATPMLVSWVQPATNGGPVTLNINGLGAVSVVDNTRSQLMGGDLIVDQVYLAYYSGSVFILLSETATTGSSTYAQSSITGWQRPSSGTYATATITGATTIQIPAGAGYIVQPGDSVVGNLRVTWAQQSVTLAYAATAWITHVLIDSAGVVVQIPNAVTNAQLRDNIFVCSVEHATGSATNILTMPAIFGDDGYLSRDTTSLLGSKLISGGLVSGNPASLAINNAAGVIFMPGSNPNDVDQANLAALGAVTTIPFNPVYINGAGVQTLVAPTTSVDVTNYNPGGLSALTAITANNAVIHRLYYMLGKYFLVYGQAQYPVPAGMTVNNANAVHAALTHLSADRSNYKQPVNLSSAVLLAEIIVAQGLANFGAATEYSIIAATADQYVFGGAQSIAEAPAGPLVYGRNASSGWVSVISSATPAFTGNPTITSATARVVENMNPVGAGYAGLQVQQAGVNWYTQEVTYPDDKVYFRSYNPSTGALRFTTTYNLATGAWNFPAGTTVGGNPMGNVAGPGSATANAVALYDGTTGKLLKDGPVPGTSITHDVQTSPTDNTAGRVLLTGAFGLGGTEAFGLPAGLGVDRPASPNTGDTRLNTNLGMLETYNGVDWVAIPPPFGYKQGLELSVNATTSSGINISAGAASSSDATSIGGTIYAIGKRLDTIWAPGGSTATPAGGRAVGSGASASQKYWGVFLLINPVDGSVDVGFDSSPTAANLMTVAAGNPSDYGFTKYRRIGWVKESGLGSYTLLGFDQIGDVVRLRGGYPLLNYSAGNVGPAGYVATTVTTTPEGLHMLTSVAVQSGSGYVKFYPYNPATATSASLVVSASTFDFYSGGSGLVVVPAYSSKVCVVASASVGIQWSQQGWVDEFSTGV